MKGRLRALSLVLGAAGLALVAAMPAQARIQLDALGGEVLIEGFLSSEARARMSNEKYLTQWLQRLQIEASIKYTDVGIFDELSFVTVVRPEFDTAQYYGDSLSGGHSGNNADKGGYMGDQFTYFTDPVGFSGFNGFFFGAAGDPLAGTPTAPAGLITGGIGKIVEQGFENPSWLRDNFDVTFNHTAQGNNKFVLGNGLPYSVFPEVALRSDMELRCTRCVDLDNDALDVAMGNTDSSGRLYPFRELYMDGVVGDFWLRVGKQQIVWGKTDFFRLQDLVNPVDFGQHFFFDSFEDIRIPQWIASLQWKAGSLGPLTDNAIQLVWNFDEFQRVGLGNPTHPWAHPFSKDISTFAIFNHFFSVEPCVSSSAAIAFGMSAQTVCGSQGPNDQRLPSGFGQPVGLSTELRPDWDIENTEAGLRWEFRFSDFHFAVSEWYGWNDTPVFRFHSVNVPTALLGSNAGTGMGTPDRLVFDLMFDDLFGAGGIPIEVMDPTTALNAIAGGGVAAPLLDPLKCAGMTAAACAGLGAGATSTAANALALAALQGDNAEPFYRTGALLGGQTSVVHSQSHTTGLSMDYFEPWSGLVFRIESSITWDELVNNTREPDWVDTSDVMRWSFGLDRPTFIKFLNKDRTFFLSQQIFDTWYWDHEGGKHTGFLSEEHNFIYTFFFQTHYLRDTLIPLAFFVWEEASNSYVMGANTEWLIDNHWSVKAGLHMIWEGDDNQSHDSGPFTSFIQTQTGPGAFVPYPYQPSILGPAHAGIGALRNNDEVFFQLKYQF